MKQFSWVKNNYFGIGIVVEDDEKQSVPLVYFPDRENLHDDLDHVLKFPIKGKKCSYVPIHDLKEVSHE